MRSENDISESLQITAQFASFGIHVYLAKFCDIKPQYPKFLLIALENLPKRALKHLYFKFVITDVALII